MALLYPLCSSSAGNATFIGSEAGGILVDAGLSLRAFSRALSFRAIERNAIKAIFITHEHSDHIKGLKNISGALGVPICGSERTLEYLLHNDLISPEGKTIVAGDLPIEIGGLAVKGFHTPHDSVESLGYRITLKGGEVISICTDLGCMTMTVYEQLKGSNAVLLESNYDEAMLEAGRYPAFLKRRIASDNGHLSNFCCAKALIDLFNDGTTRFLLGHLSAQNNNPTIAFQTALQWLLKTGGELSRDFTLDIASRQTIGEAVEI